MEAIILAAGMGKRLLPLTKNKPKPMVELLGKPIIEHTLNALIRKRVSEIIIVVGYCKNTIIDYFGNEYKGFKIRYVDNKDYATTNNIYSLKLGLEQIDEDLILCEGDIVFEPDILDVIDEVPGRNIVFVGKHEPYMNGSVIKLDKKTKIVRELITGSDQAENYDCTDTYKTVNAYYLSAGFLKEHFIPTLESYLATHTMSGVYETIINVLLYKGNKQLYAHEVENTKWFEIDDENDLEMAEFTLSKDKFSLISKLYGGYWRHDFLDFCYLSNQYFPDGKFYSELADSMPKLLSNYPSGQSKLCKILARWYEEDSFNHENIIIGNGASELIRVINTAVVNNMTVPVPTFNEYESRLETNQINYFNLPINNKFKLVKEDFVESATKSESNVALLINPNNPDGGITVKSDLIWILERLGGVVIVDESFIDFSGDRNKFSVQDQVDKYPSLVVIRSISKEFGLPGLRLGYLITSNKEIKERVLECLPIWNINSMAEYFIENFPYHQDSYNKSIRQTIEDRQRLFGNLKQISFLEPLPSHANFILCKVINQSAQDLIRQLFNEFKILVKDCCDKRSIEKENFIRIAVRTEQDNKKLIEVLKKVDNKRI